MMVAFQSVIMLMRWPRAHDTDELRRNSVSSVVSCFIPREWARQNACGKQKKQPPSRSQDQKHYDVALAMLVDNFLGAEARAATIQNKVEYCKRWGYDMVAPGVKEAAKLSGGHPFPWGKFRMLQTVLSKHEFAFMIDADAMIINMEYDISELLQSMISSNSSSESDCCTVFRNSIGVWHASSFVVFLCSARRRASSRSNSRWRPCSRHCTASFSS